MHANRFHGWPAGYHGSGTNAAMGRITEEGSMKYSLPDLDYDYSALEPYYSAQMLELHHDKHHAAYVKALNEVLEQLEGARDSDDFDAITGLEKKLAFNLSGHVLHTLLWKNL